ncbi:tRNA dihydrouridine synthase DusB [Myxococcota bacterium]|nr:tRNA dihydrouridine synthase DusB [Myxococcota bacterium]
MTSIHPIDLRSLRLESNLVMAPLAGVSNLPFRLIAREAGAAMTFTETVSAKGLVTGGKKTRRLLDTSPREDPVGFQLFGSDPAVLAEAARTLEGEGAAWLDLNVGCPVKKFIRNNAGSALLRDLPLAGSIMQAIRANFSGTFSVKIRTGWDSKSIVAPEFARMAVDAGVELLSVHGRTRCQQYTGKADRQIIRRVVEAAPEIPVLANGDVTSPRDAFDMLEVTGAAGVMIGRGAIGNPWLFSQTLAASRSEPVQEPTATERLETIERHISMMESHCESDQARASLLKKYLAAYSRGMRGSARFRQATLEAEDLKTILSLTRSFFSPHREAA